MINSLTPVRSGCNSKIVILKHIVAIAFLGIFQLNCPWGSDAWLEYIGWVNSLVPSDNRPLPESMMT